MSARVRGLFSIIVLSTATASCANFATAYTGMGPANKATAFSAEAQQRFTALEDMSPADQAAVSAIDIYFDSIPEQLAVDGTTIGLRPGANAELLGSVLVQPLWIQVNQTGALPVLQRAVHAAGGNLAYCPEEGVNWRCFMLRTTVAASTSATESPAAP